MKDATKYRKSGDSAVIPSPADSSSRIQAGNKGSVPVFSRKWVSYVLLAVLLSCTVCVWRLWTNTNAEKRQIRYGEGTDLIASKVAGRLHDYEMVLQGCAGLLAISENVTRDEWRAYLEYRQVHTLFPGIQGVGFNAVIQPSELAQHIQRIRAEGFPDYTVRPEGKRDVYTAIVFLEPLDARNRRALGYDTFSEPVRRAAMEQARDTGAASISGKITLVQETDTDVQSGLVMYIPVYAMGAPLNNVAERRTALKGYVSAPFRMNDLMRGVFPNPEHDIDFRIYDGPEVSPDTLMYDSDDHRGAPDSRVKPMLSSRKPLDLYGHQWTLSFETRPSFEAGFDQETSLGILAAGLVIGLLAFLFIRALEKTRERASSLARGMTLALRQSEEQYRVLNDSLPVGVMIIGPNMEVLASNARQREWFPETDYDQHPHCFAAFRVPPRTEPCERCPVRKAFQDGREHTAAIEANTSRGLRTLFVTAAPLFGPDGEVRSVHETIEDITEREQTQGQLRESEQKYRELIENANSIILHWTHDGRITFLNEFGQRFFGYSEAEILGRHVVGTIVPETESTGRDLRPLMDRICTDPVGFEHNINENIRRNGEKVWIAWTNKVAFDEQGRVEGILSIGTDITERRRAESALRESEARYRGLFEDCPTSLWEEDFSGVKTCIDGLRQSGVTDFGAYFDAHPAALRQCADMVKVLDVNRATLELLQYEQREDLCADLSHVFREDSYALFQEELVSLASGNKVFQAEAINRNRHGEKLHVNMTVAIVPGHEETWSQVFVSLTDISSRVRAEEELRTLNEVLEKRIEERTAELALAKDRAESADRLKSAFLSAMSHELRTPLNSIIGFTGIVLQGLPGPLNPEQTKQLGMVQTSARHLLALINDVLDLSKIEAGQLEVEARPFDARESVEKAVHLVTPLAEKKGLTLSADVSPEVGELTSDSRRFEQILINLINNGLKFTEKGHVRVECAVEGQKLVTRVVDTGIGIKPEDMGKLFQAFQQVDAGLTRSHEGTGLGLSICKRLVEKLGGRIWVESQWGVGSVFTFTLPTSHN